MRFLSCLVLLFCLPVFLLSQEIPRDFTGQVDPWELFRPENLSADQYFQFIDLLENEAFLNSLSSEEFDAVVDFATKIVRFSAPDCMPYLQEEYEQEIEQLMEDLYGGKQFSLATHFDAEPMPAICYQNPDIQFCKGWIKRKAQHFGHWCKKHKKPLIIGAVVVGVATVAIVTAGTGTGSAVAVGGALVGNSMDSPPPDHIHKPGEVYAHPEPSHPPPPLSTHTPLIEEQAEIVKVELYQQIPEEALNVLPQEEPTFWEQLKEKGREAASQFAHGAYEVITEQLQPVAALEGGAHQLLEKVSPSLNQNSPFEENPQKIFQSQVAAGHQKIDDVFDTEYASLYSDEAKAAKERITTGILPPPGAGGTKLKAAPLLQDHELERILTEIKQLENTQPNIKYKAISRICNKNNLNEEQIRTVLNKSGINPPPRPKGIPQDYTVKASKNGRGVSYRQEIPKKNGTMYPEIEVRVMEGNPNSPNVGQQKPYVKHTVNGKCLDKYGNFIPDDHFDAHIPLNEYNFEKLSKIKCYE